MQPLLSKADMRHADQTTIEGDGVPSLLLMARAGRAVADAVMANMPQGRVLILAGSGNNGGDGLVAAVELLNHGYDVRLCLLQAAEHLRGDAAACYRAVAAQGSRIACMAGDACSIEDELAQCDGVVDALFGSGLSRPLTGRAAAWVHALNACAKPVLSVDIASGLDGDSGLCLGIAVRATWTLPIATPMRGQWLRQGARYSGKMLAAADIGIPHSAMQQHQLPALYLLTQSWLDRHQPSAFADAHKGHFGHVWIIGGAVGTSGAPQLAARGAIAAHAGLVSIACPDAVYAIIAAQALEVMVHPMSSAPWQHADAIVVGPGWGQQQQAMLHTLLASSIPLLIDADALNMIAVSEPLQAAVQQREATTILTPHPGEAARLLGTTTTDIQHNRLESCRALQQRFACSVILKGQHTLIDDGERISLCPFGSPRLARGGSGDVLAGVCGALLARRLPAREVMNLAVAWHAQAGERNDWHGTAELARSIAALVDTQAY